jgi:type IV pilus assembly protein PilV
MRARVVLGFTLLEVLIAVVVLALGIMGGVALQMAALRSRHQAALLS